MAVTIPLPDAEQSHRIALNRASKATSSTQAFRQNKKFLSVLLEIDAALTDYGPLMTFIKNHDNVFSAYDQIDGMTPPTVEDGYQTILVTQMHIREDPVPLPPPE